MSLYIVGTPIGNLEDITLRALRILKEVDVILCEDTRVTKKLLSHYDIPIKKISIFNEQKSGLSVEKVIDILEDGENVALVTDAGTPGISDPGSLLVRKIQELKKDIEVISIPGPSALTASLSVSGVLGGEFVFLGFLPNKKGRETLFKEIESFQRVAVFYESPHRILKTLESLKKYVPERRIVVCREITKFFEQVVSGSPEDIIHYFVENPEKTKGEFVVIVEP